MRVYVLYLSLPKFLSISLQCTVLVVRWIERQTEVGKENVNERLAAMGAATAQVNH